MSAAGCSTIIFRIVGTVKRLLTRCFSIRRNASSMSNFSVGSSTVRTPRAVCTS
ncbi:hypothetical protein AB7M38_001865 [Bradyrhizobium diazoefficiens]